MQLLLLITLILFSFSVMATDALDNQACGALMESMKIGNTPNADGSMRRVRLSGKTDKDEDCIVDFMPDYCTFQIDKPLKTPMMYYLMDTDDTSVSIKFRRGDDFYMNTFTKEVKYEAWNVKKFTKKLNLKKSDTGYEMDFLWQEGKLIKDTLAKFSCVLK